MSENPEKRLQQHNLGMTRSTKHRRPFRIIYKERCENRINARKREKYLKSGSGREFLKDFSNKQNMPL